MITFVLKTKAFGGIILSENYCTTHTSLPPLTLFHWEIIRATKETLKGIYTIIKIITQGCNSKRGLGMREEDKWMKEVIFSIDWAKKINRIFVKDNLICRQPGGNSTKLCFNPFSDSCGKAWVFVRYENNCIYYEMAKLNSKKKEKLCINQDKSLVGLAPAHFQAFQYF